MDQRLFEGHVPSKYINALSDDDEKVLSDKIRAYASKGISAIHAALAESELGNPEPIQDLDVGLYEFVFTYGPLRGRIHTYQAGLVRPDFDIEIDGHEPYRHLPYYVNSAKHQDEEATPMLTSNVVAFLEDTLEKHVPAKAVSKK